MKDADGDGGRKGTPTVTAILSDGSLVELLYDPQARRTAFAVWRESHWSIEHTVATPEGERLVPFSPNNNLIQNEAVLLPAQPRENGTEEELVAGIERFLHRYIDVSPTFEKTAAYYILLTLVYDAFNELQYLRLRGDFGTGKTRTLLTIR